MTKQKVKALSFMDWLYTHLADNAPIGDLARDASDDSVPHTGSIRDLESSMNRHTPCDGAMETFIEARKQYRTYRYEFQKRVRE